MVNTFFIEKVGVSGLALETSYAVESSCGFAQSFEENGGIISQIRP
jgi:hypothetical protein